MQDADLAWAWMTSPATAGTGCSPHALQDRRPASPGRLPAVTLIVILPAARPRYAQAARAQSPPALAPGLRHHGHEPEREAPVPIDYQVQQLITGRQRPMPGKTFLPGRIRHGPSMYEMEGPRPAPPRRLASCLVFAARRAPPAGARYPREGPVSRLLPRSRRRPRVVPVSSGESIITTAASTAQGPAASHFLFFRYPRKTPQKAGSYPHFTGYPRVYSQPAHRLPSVSRRTPQPPVPNARCYVTS